ncbi:MAG: DUF373 family protein [Candidatus Diapherotrites archaeon]|nr:DUF373 family protein [Candidatus Diapherotrites archaeon]
MAKNKILVLCVDRDDDLGKKAGIKAPIIGEKANLKAAQALALADPTESDVNAIYQAVATYRKLKEEGEYVEVATITGHRVRGTKADREVARQLENLLEEGKYTSVALVTDGADDEQILPMLQSRVKIEFVKTVLVKQTKELEKSYYVVKEILKDPYFARLILGVPGLMALIGVTAWLLGMEHDALKLVLLVGGAYLFFRGFGIEDFVSKTLTEFKKSASIERASFPLYISALVLFVLSVWAGYDYDTNFVMQRVTTGLMGNTAKELMVFSSGFMVGAMVLFVLAGILFLVGRMVDMYHKKRAALVKRYARSIVSLVTLAILVQKGGEFILCWNDVIQNGPKIADLMWWVVISFILTAAGFYVINYIYAIRYVKPRLKRGLDVKGVNKKKLGEITSIDYKNRCFYFISGDVRQKSSFGEVLEISNEKVVISRS